MNMTALCDRGFRLSQGVFCGLLIWADFFPAALPGAFPVVYPPHLARTLIADNYPGCNRVVSNVGLLAAQAAEIKVSENNLHWFDWERYSRRQDAAMKFGGLKGKTSFTGDLGPFLPYLRLGEAVNVGQATTFGLGRFCLKTGRAD